MLFERELLRRHASLPEPELRREDTALLVIDLQYGDAHPDFGLLKRMRDRGDGPATEYYLRRLQDLVIPNIRRLQDAFRAAGMEVIHTRIESLTRDGRDRSLEHKSLGIHHPPGSKEAEILPEVAPQGDEIVISKTCGGVFNGTNIEYVLRNLGIRNLVIGGVVTSGCVELAVRDAADRSFAVVLVEDATATWTPEMQAAAVRAMREIYAKVKTTDEVVEHVRALGAVPAAVEARD
jgi:nicotinamidase-related amidase